MHGMIFPGNLLSNELNNWLINVIMFSPPYQIYYDTGVSHKN